MSVRPTLAALDGKWKGKYRLHTTWLPEKTHDSETTAEIELRVNGQFLAIEYDWEYDGKRQEGVMIVGCDEESEAVQAIWTDSWHMSHKFMVCDGTIDGDGRVEMKGFYTVPDNPDWEWRTEIIPDNRSLKITMYNVTPDGAEDIAVEADYTRE